MNGWWWHRWGELFRQVVVITEFLDRAHVEAWWVGVE